jgi:hypothetical protein
MADSPEHSQLANELLLKHHLENPKIGKLCCALAYQWGPSAGKRALAVAEKFRYDEAMGLSLLANGDVLLVRSRSECLSTFNVLRPHSDRRQLAAPAGDKGKAA